MLVLFNARNARLIITGETLKRTDVEIRVQKMLVWRREAINERYKRFFDGSKGAWQK